MFRRILPFILALLLAAGIAAAENVTLKHYVCRDWSGEYTGEVDSNQIPFGYGIFVSSMPMDNEMWHYVGYWKDGVPEGEGAVYFDNGSIWKGTFSNGQLVDGMQYTAAGMTAVVVRLERSSFGDDDYMYIGNKKSKRFHTLTCPGVEKMSDKNKVFFHSRDEAIDAQYVPCGECNP